MPYSINTFQSLESVTAATKAATLKATDGVDTDLFNAADRLDGLVCDDVELLTVTCVTFDQVYQVLGLCRLKFAKFGR